MVFEDSSGFSDPPHIAAAVSEYLESQLSLAGMHVEGNYRVESHIVFCHRQIGIYYSVIFCGTIQFQTKPAISARLQTSLKSPHDLVPTPLHLPQSFPG
jgi:hypothetical protein